MVAGGGVVQVAGWWRVAADQGVRPGGRHRRRRRGARGPAASDASVPGSAVEHDVDLGDVVPDWRRRRADATPSTALAAAATAGAASGFGQHGDRLGAPAGNARARVSAPATASGFARNCSVSDSPVRSPAAQGEDGEEQGGRAADLAAAGAQQLAEAAPDRPSGTAPPTRGTNGQNRPRPKSTSAAGSTNRAESIANTTPMRAANAEAAQVSCSDEQQRQQPEGDRAAAGQDRLGGTRAARRHRGEPVLLAAQPSR